MSDTKIKTSNIGNLAVTHALLHTDMDLTSKTVQVATPTSNTHPATKAYVDTEVSNLIDSAPGTLDTLNELAAAVNDDANFAATVTSGLAGKLPLAGGTMTGNIIFGDSDKAIFGAGNDLQIYHDGLNSYVKDVGTGTLNIQSNGTQVNIQKPDGTKMLEAINNGNVVLYSNGVERLRANGQGIDVTGTVNAVQLDITAGTDAKIYTSNSISEVGNGIFAIQSVNSAGSALKPLGFRAEDIRFATGPSERLRIDSSGNVLVGTTTNSYNRAKFTVFGEPGAPATSGDSTTNVGLRLATTTGNSQSMDFGIYNSSPYGGWIQASNSGGLNNTSPIALNPNGGNVGIGTSSPDSLLHLQKTRGTISGGSSDTGAVIKLHTEAQWEGGYGNNPAASTNDYLGSIEFSTGDGSSGEGVRAAIRGTVDSYYNENSIVFETCDQGDTTLDERMRILHSGNVGIGTSSPAEKLEIKDYKDGAGNNTNGVGLLLSSTSSSAGSNSANGGTGIEFTGYGHNYNGAGTSTAGSNPIAIKINPIYEYWGQNNAMSNYGQTYPYLKFDFLKSDNSSYITPLLVSSLGNGRVAIGNDTASVSHRLSLGSDAKSINYRVTGSGGHAIADGTYEENARSFSLGGSDTAFITEGTVSNSNKWRVKFEGDFGNNYQGGGLNFPAAQIYVTNTQPTVYIGSTNITVSRDSGTGKLKVTNQSSSYAVHFTGKITVWDHPQSNRPTFDSEMQAISLQGTDDYGTNLYGGLVMKTPAYSEYHFQWSGTQSHSLTFTCGSYQMSTMEYTSHQTNGGNDIHKYIFGKWGNNHTSHNWVEMENNGSTWGLSTSFTATDQSGGTAAANGKLVINETYSSGSVSTRTLVVKTYYGGWGLTFA